MQYSIQPILAKIGDQNESNVLSVTINNNTGTSCRFQWQLMYQAPTVTGKPVHRSETMGNGSFTISSDDYTTFNSKTGIEMQQYAADYVASHLTPNLIINS